MQPYWSRTAWPCWPQEDRSYTGRTEQRLPAAPAAAPAAALAAALAAGTAAAQEAGIAALGSGTRGIVLGIAALGSER